MIERPMMVFSALQKAVKTQNIALCYHANVETMTILLNNTQFPTSPVSANWE